MTATPPQKPGGPAWDRATLRDPHAQPDKAARVEAMFDAIAPTYERVNAVASLGRDAVWRRRALAAAGVRAGDVALDICCGTGDMVRALAACVPALRLVIGLDFAAQMLAAGRYAEGGARDTPGSGLEGARGAGQAGSAGKPHRGTPDAGSGAPIQLIRGDALRLPLADASVDVLTCVFGVRNFADLGVGLREMYRVARPGGRVVILEFTLPERAWLRWGYRVYCERVLPLLGRLISQERVGAYEYLARSIRTFEPAAALAERLRGAGFADVTATPMNLGGVVLYRGVKGPGPGVAGE